MKDEAPSLWAIAVACIASVAAALVTSQLWVRGTVLTAAITPVIVALVSELLHGAGNRLGDRLRVPFRARVAILTAAIALVVGVSLLTAPKLIAGKSLKDVSRGTTIFADAPKRGNEGGGGAPTPTDSDGTTTDGPPELVVSEPAEFGPTPVGVPVTGVVTVSNPDDAPASVSIETREDGSPTTAAGEFTHDEGCSSVGPDATCKLTVTFAPQADEVPERATNRTALLAVTHVETGSEQTRPLVGLVQPAP